MKMTMKVCGVFMAIALVGSVSQAQYRGGQGHGGGSRGYGGGGYRGEDGGGHYGYYHNSRGDLVFGLLGLGLLAAVVAEQPVYVQPAPVVYQTAPPAVYYVEQPQVVYQAPPAVQPPQVVYVQQQPQQVQPVPPPPVANQAPPVAQQPVQAEPQGQPQVVEQPAAKPSIPADPKPPLTITVNVQNSNGSFTPVALHQEGTWWVGPRGEYYKDGFPTVGQLRPLYGR